MNTPTMPALARVIPFPHPIVHGAATIDPVTRRMLELRRKCNDLECERDQLRLDLDAANARAESLSRPRDRGAIELAFVMGVVVTVLLRRWVG